MICFTASGLYLSKEYYLTCVMNIENGSFNFRSSKIHLYQIFLLKIKSKIHVQHPLVANNCLKIVPPISQTSHDRNFVSVVKHERYTYHLHQVKLGSCPFSRPHGIDNSLRYCHPDEGESADEEVESNSTPNVVLTDEI